jgi:phospholipid/cholesterol/gamma-HCH transport system permease protein
MRKLRATESIRLYGETMNVAPAALTQTKPEQLALSGSWTALGLGADEDGLIASKRLIPPITVVDCQHLTELDTAGAWTLNNLLQNLRQDGVAVSTQGLRPEFKKLLELVAQHVAETAAKSAPTTVLRPGWLHRIGQGSMLALNQGLDLLGFVGEAATALAKCLAQPRLIRWRPILYNIRTAGFDALPIVGLLSFLLGIVVAYQGADQLRQYGANIFVADLVGLSMLREFAPLMTAIIIAGRSGSAYAAQIGTMAVTEEIDAMRTIGIAPMELLVLPKVVALVIAMPLLTVFADVLGVLGGMIMARVQLGVGYVEFLDRLSKAVSVSSYVIGVGKAPVFAVIIAVVGCFQGFRTHGGADSVGRQTTRSVVQSIFLVIVADALFSIAFSVLDL